MVFSYNTFILMQNFAIIGLMLLNNHWSSNYRLHGFCCYVFTRKIACDPVVSFIVILFCSKCWSCKVKGVIFISDSTLKYVITWKIFLNKSISQFISANREILSRIKIYASCKIWAMCKTKEMLLFICLTRSY